MAVEEGQLSMEIGGQTMKLVPISENLFASGGTRVTVKLEEGKVTELTRSARDNSITFKPGAAPETPATPRPLRPQQRPKLRKSPRNQLPSSPRRPMLQFLQSTGLPSAVSGREALPTDNRRRFNGTQKAART